MSIDERVQEAKDFVREKGVELFRHNQALIYDAQRWYKQNESDFVDLGYNSCDSRFMLEVYLPQIHWQQKSD